MYTNRLDLYKELENSLNAKVITYVPVIERDLKHKLYRM